MSPTDRRAVHSDRARVWVSCNPLVDDADNGQRPRTVEESYLERSSVLNDLTISDLSDSDKPRHVIAI